MSMLEPHKKASIVLTLARSLYRTIDTLPETKDLDRHEASKLLAETCANIVSNILGEYRAMDDLSGRRNEKLFMESLKEMTAKKTEIFKREMEIARNAQSKKEETEH